MSARSKFGVSAVLSLSAIAVAMAVGGALAQSPSGFSVAVDDKGQLRVPQIDYRKEWVALGAWAVGRDDGEAGSEGMHVVYTQPESVDAYRETGKFPDGAVLVKELFSAKTEDMTTGTISRAGDTTGWFVMVKDAKGRFPDNPLWGDGWGWSYFDAASPTKTASSDYKDDCLGCHVPAQNTDWIYTQAYPVLTK